MSGFLSLATALGDVTAIPVEARYLGIDDVFVDINNRNAVYMVTGPCGSNDNRWLFVRRLDADQEVRGSDGELLCLGFYSQIDDTIFHLVVSE